VSTPDKPDHARGWRFVEKLLDEEEDERVKGLGEDELRAELAKGATDPVTEWSADELLARAESEAAKSPPAAVRASPAADPAPRPGAAPEPPARQVARVVPIRNRWKTVGLVAAAGLALVLRIKSAPGPDIVAHRDDRAIAEAQRDGAEASCARKDWTVCKQQLDDAAKLDPGGESEPRVQKARAAIAAGMTDRPEKPGP